MKGARVIVREPRADDEDEFLLRVRASRTLHRPWVHPPADSDAFRVWLRQLRRETHRGYLVCLPGDDALAGVVNIAEIVRGCFWSGYLGYYAFTPHAGKGLMSEGLALVVTRAFRDLDLHRLEANIQPGNRDSIALVRRLGFRKEGLSPRYLKIGGRWRDHERWTIMDDEWRRR